MELLAPAGSWNAFIAAIENGADAVYMGGKNFSARQYAENFDIQKIEEAVNYAHFRDRKVYITVNTLIDYDEFEPALDYIQELYGLGVDAVIVQDLGLVKAIRTVIPGMRIHASTQMTIHNAQGASFLHEQGLKRIVLAREMTLDELQIICRELKDIEFEVFVHGALCYSYSGQCLFSSMVGGRSGNRGRCAQPCRLPYDLYSATDNKRLDIQGKGRYLLSPSDLALLDYLPALQKAGVHSLKIEGRMKRPEYVAVVTRTYREALKMLKNDQEYKIPEEAKNNLRKIFNRNFSTGYLWPDKTGFLSSKKPNNRGVYTGRVVDQTSELVTRIKLSDSVKPGDILEIWVNRGKSPVITLKEIVVEGRKTDYAGRGDIITVTLDTRAAHDDRVFKIYDEELLTSAAMSMKPNTRNKIAITVDAYLQENNPLKLVFSDEKGNKVEVLSESNAQAAKKYPLQKDTLLEKIDRLGNTPFKLAELNLEAEEGLMIPFSEINDARRRACEQLEELNLKPFRPSHVDPSKYHQLKKQFLSSKENNGHHEKSPVLSIIVSGAEEAFAALKSGADRVYIALEGIAKNRQVSLKALEDLIIQANKSNSTVVPALPRIQKPAESSDWDQLLSVKMESIMAGNPGALKWCLDNRLKTRGDYSLNIFNPYALNYLFDMGVESACLSPELNFTQIKKFNNMDKVELIIHGELILMASQFCMLSGILGDPGKKCAGYCARDSYFIQDEKGYKFPVETDNNCRFYVFNSRNLCILDDLPRVLSWGAGSLRIEARRSSEQEIKKVVSIYREVLDKLIDGQKPDLDLYKEELAEISPSPFTKGHYYRGVL